MNHLQRLDILLVLWINQPAGRNALLDRSVFDIADSTILQGGFFIAQYWWLWLKATKSGQSAHRREIAVALIGGIVAAVASRILQVGLPFHNRPLHTPWLGLHLPIGVDPGSLNTFSSFPSDHAVLFFALCVPLWARSRSWGLAAAVWTLFVICLPRIYLGYHWPSDVAAGAVMGVVIMLVVMRLLMASSIPDRALRLEGSHPVVFYTVSWLLLLELSVLFYDLRHFALDVMQLAKMLVA
jgi:undecaprenyl-diphosphatase